MAQASARRGSQAMASLRTLGMGRNGPGLARPASPAWAGGRINCWSRDLRAAPGCLALPAWAGAQAEKAGPVPARAGDQAGNLGQAGMNRAVPQEALSCDHDLVGLSAPAAHDGGAGLDPACGLGLAAGEPVEEELGLGREPAPDLLLEFVRHGPDQEITAEGGWG